jgi:hypothetical protein
VRDERGRDSDVGSLIGGGEGVLLQAGRDLSVRAAEITSPGDVDLFAGRDLAVTPGAIVERHRRVESHSFAGVTASVGTNVVSAAQDLRRAVDTFDSGYGNAGYRAIGMASGVLQGVDAVRSLTNPGVSASLSLGFSQSRMSQSEQLHNVVPALIEAGGDLTFAAGRDLSLQAVQARAGGDLLVSAGRDLAIESAQATYWQAQRHSSASASIGLDMGWSVAGGPSVGVTLSGQVAGGRADASGTGQVESALQAGHTLAVLTGNDALIAGAQLRGRDVLLDIGGDLHVATRADTARLRGSSYQAGASLTIGLVGPSSLSLNLGGGRDRADSTLVNRQTSIIAEERLDAYVEGHTQLDGGLIASLSGDLSLDTGTFGFTDIEERARSDSRRASVSISLGGGSPSLGIEGELAHTATDAVTRATIGEGEITIRDEDAQRAREEAGETREVAALNRDLDMARETLRDERAGVRFYASDSSVRELASGFAQTRANIAAAAEILSKALEALSPEERARLEEIEEKLDPEADVAERAEAYADDLVERGELSEEDRDETAALIEAAALEAAGDPEAAQQLAACMAPGRQGFNLHDLLFPSAHAQRMANPAMSPAGGQGAAAIGRLGQEVSGAVGRMCEAVVNSAQQSFRTVNSVLTLTEMIILQSWGFDHENVLVSVTGEEGGEVRILGREGSETASLEGRDAEGRRVVFDLRRLADGEYELTGASRYEGLIRETLTPRQAIDLTDEMFGPVGGGFTAHDPNDHLITTVFTPNNIQLPLIFVTPAQEPEPLIFSTPIYPVLPYILAMTIPDVGWVTTWMSQNSQDPEILDRNREHASSVTTRFLSGATVSSFGVTLGQGTVYLGPTLDRIARGEHDPHPRDGTIHKNHEGRLPMRQVGHYTEYVHRTPGMTSVGPERVIIGADGEVFYTPDHYKTFIPVK